MTNSTQMKNNEKFNSAFIYFCRWARAEGPVDEVPGGQVWHAWIEDAYHQSGAQRQLGSGAVVDPSILTHLVNLTTAGMTVVARSPIEIHDTDVLTLLLQRVGSYSTRVLGLCMLVCTQWRNTSHSAWLHVLQQHFPQCKVTLGTPSPDRPPQDLYRQARTARDHLEAARARLTLEEAKLLVKPRPKGPHRHAILRAVEQLDQEVRQATESYRAELNAVSRGLRGERASLVLEEAAVLRQLKQLSRGTAEHKAALAQLKQLKKRIAKAKADQAVRIALERKTRRMGPPWSPASREASPAW